MERCAGINVILSGGWFCMKKITIITAAGALVVIAALFFVFRNDQLFLARQANAEIDAGGLKLMMTETDAKELLGEPEEFVQGFGGYMLEYPGKGISLTFLDDTDTDFYKKINQIEITNPTYSIFKVRAGDDHKSAVESILSRGFSAKEGYTNYWKRNLFISLEQNGGKVSSIAIGISDKVASTRIY